MSISRFPVSGHRLGLLYIMVYIPICSGQTNNEFRLQPLNPAQHWSCWRPWGHPTPVQGPRRSTFLGICSSGGCHTSTCSGICQSRGPRRSTSLNLPRDPIFGRPTCLDLPRDLISRRLSCFSLPGDLYPDPGTPGSQVAIVLDRISFKESHL